LHEAHGLDGRIVGEELGGAGFGRVVPGPAEQLRRADQPVDAGPEDERADAGDGRQRHASDGGPAGAPGGAAAAAPTRAEREVDTAQRADRQAPAREACHDSHRRRRRAGRCASHAPGRGGRSQGDDEQAGEACAGRDDGRIDEDAGVGLGAGREPEGHEGG
jgi:hypothetical protein